MTDLFSEGEAAVANELENLARLAGLGARGTAGPKQAPSVPDGVVVPPHPAWVEGWWSRARRVPAHPGRVGGEIRPVCTVVHTTDMPPEDWNALLRRWQLVVADGACAHFVIGRTEADGVVQLVPITRNANHAGGPGHGVFVDQAGGEHHPNLVAVGIELHCAGGVRRIGNAWRFVEDGKAYGAPLPDAEVVPDPHRPGRGWHTVTEYQRATASSLLDDLEAALGPMPAGWHARSLGELVPSWAQFQTGRVVGHVSLDPAHRSDPWPPTCEWLRARQCAS